MTPAYEDGLATAYQGDCLTVLREMPTESVHCVVTSPPYWGLRDYGAAGQLGLEATPDEYVATMGEVFREVRRVLRSDGTLWLNLGDSYAGSNQTGGDGSSSTLTKGGKMQAQYGAVHQIRRGLGGLKAKDLVGIPWRVAFALRSDGWYLRSDIVWSKPNPMPESVTDRPTKAHEYLFLLAKAERYYYDAEAIREPAVGSNHHDLTGNGYLAPGQTPQIGNRKALAGPTYERHRSSVQGGQDLRAEPTTGRNRRSVWEIATRPYPEAHFATFPENLVAPCIQAGCPVDGVVLDPFAGSGTTLAVAKRLGRRSIGIELNAAYLDLIRRRVGRVTYQPTLFPEVAS